MTNGNCKLYWLLLIFNANSQDFGALLMNNLAARGVAGDDLDSWKAVARAVSNQIAKVQGL